MYCHASGVIVAPTYFSRTLNTNLRNLTFPCNSPLIQHADDILNSPGLKTHSKLFPTTDNIFKNKMQLISPLKNIIWDMLFSLKRRL